MALSWLCVRFPSAQMDLLLAFYILSEYPVYPAASRTGNPRVPRPLLNMYALSSLAVMSSSICHLQVSSSTSAQLSTPLSITSCQDASGRPSGMSSLLPASGAVPRISHQDLGPRRSSSWQNATLRSWQRRQAPSSPVSHPFTTHTSPQPLCWTGTMKGVVRRPRQKAWILWIDTPLSPSKQGGASCHLCLLCGIRKTRLLGPTYSWLFWRKSQDFVLGHHVDTADLDTPSFRTASFQNCDCDASHVSLT